MKVMSEIIKKMETEENKKENSYIGLFVLNLTLVGLIVSFSMMIYKSTSGRREMVSNVSSVKHFALRMDQSKIEAKSVFVYDVLNDKVLYAKNPDEVLPLASLVKVMTVYTARNLADKDEVISVKKEDLSEEGDNGLLVGEKWKLKDISDFSLVVSSNDGARMIASAIGAKISQDENLSRREFVKKMNEFAESLGLKTLHFENETGLDTSDGTGGVGSSRDFAKLVSFVLEKYPDILEQTAFLDSNIKSLNKVHKVSNTNDFVEQISGAVASKTGFTDKAGGNLVTVFNVGLGHPVVAVVLGSSTDGRFKDMLYVASSTINQVASQK